jgi:uncharacterized protein (DUF1778 family)
MRRRLSKVVRKAMLSYYTQEESQEIVKAAKKRGVSLSNFIATAALREAAAVNEQTKKH